MQGIAKSGYNALYLLNKMGTEVLLRGDGYLVTRNGSGIQLLLYNYCHYDALFQKHYMGDESADACYDRFVEKADSRFLIELSGLPAGEYKLRKWQVSREHGSSFDAWMDMGEPEYLDPEEISLLKAASMPRYRVWNEHVTAAHTLHLQTLLEPHEIQIIDIQLGRDAK